MAVSPACTLDGKLGGKLGAVMRDGPFAKLLLCSIAPCWLPGGLAACGLRDPKHEIPKQKREAIGQHPPLQQDITRRAMKGTDSLEAFHMGIHTQLNELIAKFR